MHRNFSHKHARIKISNVLEMKWYEKADEMIYQKLNSFERIRMLKNVVFERSCKKIAEFQCQHIQRSVTSLML